MARRKSKIALRKEYLEELEKWATSDASKKILWLLKDAHDSLDAMATEINRISEFLARHTNTPGITAHQDYRMASMAPSFQFDEDKYFEVPKPEHAEMVYEAIKEYTTRKALELAPYYVELLGKAPSNWEINALENEMKRNWDEDDDEYKEICIRRVDLQETTGLHHQTLKRCTDHLQYRGFIHQVGKIGGTEKIVRYGLPIDQIYGLTTWFYEYCDEHWPDRPGYN